MHTVTGTVFHTISEIHTQHDPTKKHQHQIQLKGHKAKDLCSEHQGYDCVITRGSIIVLPEEQPVKNICGEKHLKT
ncbi:hypothetical protein L1987_71479 [Smallanthus sonchifolius]|uniref:Uncharacterized protein n=1 Tax=Smallanthus sonchifolius TaxID=185202 RepID=A0ACB9ASJ3_9ASTR|nr:hypothetical protein L1987_71479 [Smallanthus sonchifolius]